MEKIKKNLFKVIIFTCFTAICGIFAVSKAGVKDGATFTLSVVLTVLIITLAKKDFKKATYLFIISMPILVTARKLLYLDFFILNINFESIIILYLFIIKYKDVIKGLEKLILNKALSTKLFYYIGFFIIASYTSCIFSKEPIRSLELTTTSVLIPILLIIIVMGLFNEKDIKNIVYSLIVSINLSCLYGMIQVLGIGLSLNAIKVSREYLTFGYHNVNIFVNVALLVYPLLLNELLYKSTDKKEKLFLIPSLLLQTTSIFITFSRGAWLALAMVVVAIFFSKKYKVIFAIMIVMGMFFGNLLLPSILSRGNGNQAFLANTSNTARILSIYTSKEIITDNIYGVGLGNFNENYRKYVISGYLNINEEERKVMSSPLYSLEHAHNFFLSIGVELGVFALISILLIFTERITKSIRNFEENRAILISIGVFIFIGVTTGIELNHKGVITNTYILWILFGLISLQELSKSNAFKEQG